MYVFKRHSFILMPPLLSGIRNFDYLSYEKAGQTAQLLLLYYYYKLIIVV